VFYTIRFGFSDRWHANNLPFWSEETFITDQLQEVVATVSKRPD
jgi:hypothetical protein